MDIAAAAALVLDGCTEWFLVIDFMHTPAQCVVNGKDTFTKNFLNDRKDKVISDNRQHRGILL